MNKYGIKNIETSTKDTINIEDLFISTAIHILSKQTNNPVRGKRSQSGKTGIDFMNNNAQENSQNDGFVSNLFKNNNLSYQKFQQMDTFKNN